MTECINCGFDPKAVEVGNPGECKVVKCTNCPEWFCPECDFPPSLRDVARLKPGLCPMCLESSNYFWEQMRRRYMDDR